MDKNGNNLLCSNVNILIEIIEWIESNIFINNDIICKYWKQNHLFLSIDEWIILWININTPILSSLLTVPQFNDNNDDIKFDEIQHSAIEHIRCSIAYQENIENALKSLQIIIEKNKKGSSSIYLKESLELLSNDGYHNQYGLSSKILSFILPSKIREYIYESIRDKIKNHEYEAFNPLHLHLFRMNRMKEDEYKEYNNNKMITYGDLISFSESFFRCQPCKISKTMFEIVIIIYNISIFIEQMYYIVDESENDIICLSTMYVDLFMNINRDIIELWMSLSISYHAKYLHDVASLGFQFYNDCSFLSFHLSQLSIKTNHGNLLITDNMRQIMENKEIEIKYIWFTHYIQPLKCLGKQYFIHHLHNQRQTILSSLKIINRFNDIDKPGIYNDIKQSFSESLMSISRFLNGCRSTIPDNLLYQIGGKLLQCVCNQVIDEIMARIDISDIGMNAAHNISLIIKHITKFEILSNDLEYMTRNMDKIWKKFIKLGEILHNEQKLDTLTNQLNDGELNVFDKQTLTKLVKALWDENAKRDKFIKDVELQLDS